MLITSTAPVSPVCYLYTNLHCMQKYRYTHLPTVSTFHSYITGYYSICYLFCLLVYKVKITLTKTDQVRYLFTYYRTYNVNVFICFQEVFQSTRCKTKYIAKCPTGIFQFIILCEQELATKIYKYVTYLDIQYSWSYLICSRSAEISKYIYH